MRNANTKLFNNISQIPSALCGLGLAVGSLGLAWELTFPTLNQKAQFSCAILSLLLILPVATKFIFKPQTLLNELKHPVLGSVVPTFSMTIMIISKSLEQFQHWLGVSLWLIAIGLHVFFLCIFIHHRIKNFSMHQLIPSWFIPPVGIIVAAVTYTEEFRLLAQILLYFGMGCYFIMLPIMLYRLIFDDLIDSNIRPTLGVLAAPASLSLVGYLTLNQAPSFAITIALLSMALLMTLLICFSLAHFYNQPFSASFSSLTFPLVISATAVIKACLFLSTTHYIDELFISLLYSLGIIELFIATLVVSYVLYKYGQNKMFLSGNTIVANQKR